MERRWITKSLELPDFPLIERAEEWGISVKAVPGNYRYYGYYQPGRNEIALATPEESVFFHELAHAAHEKVKGALKPGQDPLTGDRRGIVGPGPLSDGRKAGQGHYR